MKRTYDLVFSMGAACACTECLRAAGLQFGSFPFDWLIGSTLRLRTDILVDGCDDWLRPEALEHVFSVSAIRTDAYRNKVTGITFNHDFPLGVPLAESIADVRAKYDRRFGRLRSLIARGGRVLAVYVTAPGGTVPTDDDAAYCRRRLSERFPDTSFDVLVLRCAKDAAPETVRPSDGVTFAAFDYENRADATGANPIDRERVVPFLKGLGLVARDYRSAEERRARRAAERAREYRRYGATGPLDYRWAKFQVKVFRHLQKRLARRGLA